MSSNLPGRTAKSKDERKPLLSERVRRSLECAGPEGRTRIQLAVELYQDDSYAARGRVTVLIGSLRSRGINVLLVRDSGYHQGRYVLGEFIITAVPQA